MTILKSRLAKNLVLLSILTMALVYLRKPELLHATQFQQCLQRCLNQEKTCIANCHGNKTCDANCVDAFTSCQDGCIP